MRSNHALFKQLQKPHIQGLLDRSDLEALSRALFDSQLHINPIPYSSMSNEMKEAKQFELTNHVLDEKARSDWCFVVFENEIAARIFYSE